MRTKEEQREYRIKREMQTCVHFSGIQNEKCAAGINIREIVGGDDFGWAARLPCFLDTQEVCTAICPSRQFPSREQAEKEVSDSEAATSRTLSVLRSAHEHAKNNGLGKGHGGAGSIPCPIPNCKGKIQYTVASYNGHMHGRCDSGNCVSWME